MSDFSLWFSTGLAHILDLEGYDHICYVVALAIMFSWRAWKPLLILVTAFTIGHSLSLALSIFEVVKIPQESVEFFIPLTIAVTCLSNLYAIYQGNIRFNKGNYVIALLFGLIHGLGFSYLLKMMLGKEENAFFPLLSFNLGLEFGQAVIVTMTVFLTFAVVEVVQIPKKIWQTVVSISVLCISLFLLIGRI